MEALLIEKVSKKQIAAPADLNGAAVTGARISLGEADRLAVVLSFGDSSSAVTDVTFQQHNAASGGTSKALTIGSPYFHKVAAATAFTKVELGSKASNIVPTVLADDEGILVFEVKAEELDVDGGFSYVSVNVADSTAAKVMSGLYVIHDVRKQPAYELDI
jgi:hypothetical protein